MTWRQTSPYVLQRDDGATVCRCRVEPHGWRYGAWKADAGRNAPALGYYDTADEAKAALDEPRQGALI